MPTCEWSPSMRVGIQGFQPWCTPNVNPYTTVLPSLSKDRILGLPNLPASTIFSSDAVPCCSLNLKPNGVWIPEIMWHSGTHSGRRVLTWYVSSSTKSDTIRQTTIVLRLLSYIGIWIFKKAHYMLTSVLYALTALTRRAASAASGPLRRGVGGPSFSTLSLNHCHKKIRL